MTGTLPFTRPAKIRLNPVGRVKERSDEPDTEQSGVTDNDFHSDGYAALYPSYSQTGFFVGRVKERSDEPDAESGPGRQTRTTPAAIMSDL